MCLGDLGKGWFNINQRQYEYYEIAKLLRMMELVKYMMQVCYCFFLSIERLSKKRDLLSRLKKQI